jgi:uncharacterized protein YndB with AHSA1/START domain
MTEERDPALRQADGTPPVPTPMGVRHDTFTVTLRLSVPPSEVFRAFGDSGLRRRWFKLPGRRAACRGGGDRTLLDGAGRIHSSGR